MCVPVFPTNPTQLKFTFIMYARETKNKDLKNANHHLRTLRSFRNITGMMILFCPACKTAKISLWSLFSMKLWCSQGMYTHILQEKLTQLFLTSNISKFLLIWLPSCTLLEYTQYSPNFMPRKSILLECLLLQTWFLTINTALITILHMYAIKTNAVKPVSSFAAQQPCWPSWKIISKYSKFHLSTLTWHNFTAEQEERGHKCQLTAEATKYATAIEAKTTLMVKSVYGDLITVILVATRKSRL